MRLAWWIVCTTHLGLAMAQAETLRGTVRDAQGLPLAGVMVTLTCGVAVTGQRPTAGNGTYAFANLAPCDYQLTARAGTGSSSHAVHLDGTRQEQVEDLTLSNSAAMPRPTFAASGIRGLIDPGGYSAPANAAAASSLLSGMAAANRARNAACAPVQPLAELAARHRHAPVDDAATLDYARALLAAQEFEAARNVLAPLRVEDAGTPLLHLRAQADEGLGQFPAAAQEYAQLNSREPAAEHLFAEGYEYILDGKPATAAALYRDGLRSFPRSLPLLLGLGTTDFLAGHTPEALSHFLAAAEADSADPRPYPFLAAVATESSPDRDRVNAALDRHLTLVPRDAAAHLALASMLLHQTGSSEAVAHAEAELRRSLALDPGLSEAHYQLGILLARRGSDEEAVRELQLAVALDPERREAHYRLAQELRKIGRNETASQEMQHFEQARAQDASGAGDVTRYLSVIGRGETCIQP